MKKWLIWLAAIGAILLGMGGCTYNSLVVKDEAVNQAMATIQTQEQRRYDLIPNLVRVVEGAAAFERGTLTEVIEARARVGEALRIDPESLANDPAARQQFMAAQQRMAGALGRLLLVVERYPELRANQNFLTLQAQLEGTENRIQVARMDAQKAIRDYNTARRQFPFGMMVANMAGFDQRPHFNASPGASQAPIVAFKQ